jgi:hypothetical protein
MKEHHGFWGERVGQGDPKTAVSLQSNRLEWGGRLKSLTIRAMPAAEAEPSTRASVTAVSSV